MNEQSDMAIPITMNKQTTVEMPPHGLQWSGYGQGMSRTTDSSAIVQNRVW